MIGTLFIISAPSGAGKTTLVTAVLKDLQSVMQIERVVTYTTKQPRVGDVDGVDYHFVSKDRFEELLKEGCFLEYSKAYSDYYGSPRSALLKLKKGVSSIMILDRVGARHVVNKVPEATLIWIEAPTLGVLEDRLIARGAESATKRASRIKQAAVEMAEERENPFFHYYLINGCFEQARRTLRDIILKKGVKVAKKGIKIFDSKKGENRCSGSSNCVCFGGPEIGG